jgi:hypothetical protein
MAIFFFKLACTFIVGIIAALVADEINGDTSDLIGLFGGVCVIGAIVSLCLAALSGIWGW